MLFRSLILAQCDGSDGEAVPSESGGRQSVRVRVCKVKQDARERKTQMSDEREKRKDGSRAWR